MNRSTILLIVLLLVLGAIVLLMLPSDKEREASYTPADLSLKIDSASVVKIELKQKGKLIAMENVGGKWMLTTPIHFAADPSNIAQLIGGLSKFTTGSLISTNPEKQNIFQVDSTGTTVTVTDRSGKSTSVVIGKMGPSFSEVYFRLPTSKDVYLGKGIDTWSLNKEVKDWREKTIVNQPTESIKDLTYSSGNKEFAFHRDSTGWKSGSGVLDAATMNPTLTSLSNLRADDFIDTVANLQSHPVTIAIHGSQNVNLNLYPSLPDSSKYFVQSSISSQMYVISKWTAQQLLKPIEQGHEGISKPVQVAARPKKEVPPPPPIVEKKVPQKKATTPPSIANKVPEKKSPSPSSPVVKKEPARITEKPAQKNIQPPPTSKPVSTPSTTPLKTQTPTAAPEDEGDLTVHTVSSNESMTTIAKKYNVTVEQILKWNLLKSIKVKPGQELYIYIKK
jgi:LysM repeat protein